MCESVTAHTLVGGPRTSVFASRRSAGETGSAHADGSATERAWGRG